MNENDYTKSAEQSVATSTRQEAKEQAEAGFQGFMQWTKYVIFALIAFFLAVDARNFVFKIGVSQHKTGNKTP